MREMTNIFKISKLNAENYFHSMIMLVILMVDFQIYGKNILTAYLDILFFKLIRIVDMQENWKCKRFSGKLN